MRKSLVFMVLFFVLFLVFPGWALQVSSEEVIEETSRFTKLSRQTLELLYQEAPKLFVNLERLTLATKMVRNLAQAEDRRVLQDLAEESLDTLRYLVLPKNLNLFLTAFQVYAKSLEAIRDYLVTYERDVQDLQRNTGKKFFKFSGFLFFPPIPSRLPHLLPVFGS